MPRSATTKLRLPMAPRRSKTHQAYTINMTKKPMSLLSLSTMPDCCGNAGCGRNTCLVDTPNWIYQLLFREPQASFSFLLGITSHLSWRECLSPNCIVKLTFNMSPQSSSKWHIYSYISINKDQIYCYQCTGKPCQFRLQFWLNSMSSPLNVFLWHFRNR